MIRVTFEYESVEQAIMALGKLAGIAKVRRAAEAPLRDVAPDAPEPAAQGSVVAAVLPARRGRSDKGKPRGPYKDNAAAVPAPAEGDKPQPSGVVPEAAPETKAPEPARAPSVEQTPAPGAAVPSAEEAQKALEAVFAKQGLEGARAVMAEFGVSRLRELPEAKRAAFILAAYTEAAK